MIESVKAMTDSYNEARLDGEPRMTVEEMGALVDYADIICAWCLKYIDTKPSETGMTSHGICKDCEEKIILEMALEEFKKEPNSTMNEHQERAFSYKDSIIGLDKAKYGWKQLDNYLRSREAHELMQVGRKRNVMRREYSNV